MNYTKTMTIFHFLTKILIKYGIFGIIIVALLEPVFMPFPIDTVFIPISLLNIRYSVFYAIVLVIFSTLGAAVGYSLGNSVGRRILFRIVSENKIKKVESGYIKHPFLTLLSSVITPIPYEAYTISAGIFKVDFKTYLMAATLSRLLKYVPEGILIYYYGDKVVEVISKYVHFISIILIVVVIVLLIYFLVKKSIKLLKK